MKARSERIGRGFSIAVQVAVVFSLSVAPSATRAIQLPAVLGLGGLPNFSRVVVVVMENKEYGSIIGNSSAPYINSLAKKYANATNLFGTTHPSLPNYLAITGGSTFGVTSNCTTCRVSGKSIVDQLEQAGISWKAYIQGFPSTCFAGASSGRYAKKHNPFMYYDSITQNPSRCSKIVSFGKLSTDLQNGTLPRFVWATPDMCNSMHDCSVSAGDSYLSTFLPPLLGSLGSNGILFLTWDEGTSNNGCCLYAAGGHIATVVAGPSARKGQSSSTAYDHYSILRTIEDAWHLSRLGNASCTCSKPMTDLVTTTFP